MRAESDKLMRGKLAAPHTDTHARNSHKLSVVSDKCPSKFISNSFMRNYWILVWHKWAFLSMCALCCV